VSPAGVIRRSGVFVQFKKTLVVYMAGKSFDLFIALPEATQESTGPAFAEVHLHPRAPDMAVITHRVLTEKTFRNIDEAHAAAAKFIQERLLDVEADGTLVVRP